PEGEPLTVILVELKERLRNGDERAEDGGELLVGVEVHSQQQGNGGRGEDLEGRQAAKPALVVLALGVVPANLILETLEGRIRRACCAGHHSRIPRESSWQRSGRAPADVIHHSAGMVAGQATHATSARRRLRRPAQGRIWASTRGHRPCCRCSSRS